MSSGLYQIRDKNLDTTLDLTRLKPYGDTMNDGKVQTSFTLPVKDDDKGAAAAVMLAQKMGLADPNVALRQKLDAAGEAIRTVRKVGYHLEVPAV